MRVRSRPPGLLRMAVPPAEAGRPLRDTEGDRMALEHASCGRRSPDSYQTPAARERPATQEAAPPAGGASLGARGGEGLDDFLEGVESGPLRDPFRGQDRAQREAATGAG